MEYKEIIGKILLKEKTNKNQILCIGQVQSGKTRFIINETEKAIASGQYDCVIILGGTNNLLLEQTQKRFNENKNIKNYIQINFSKWNDLSNVTLRNNKIIVYSLKGDVALGKVEKFAKYNKEFKYLIIDDESDFGSLNISKSGTASAIYNHISEIFNTVKDATYYSVTATPFANIINVNNSWNFNEIRYVKPGNGYCGIDFFFENNQYEICDDFYKDEKLNESKILEIIIDHIKRIRDNTLKKSQMIINVDISFNEQKEILEKIKKILSFIPKIIDRKFEKKDHNEVLEIINSLINNCITLNEETSEDDKKKIKNDHSIIIGGNMISRGYTFEELITCIMINEPSSSKYSADTLLQRCRWFGYRHRILENSNVEHYKIMKILITKNILNCLNEAKILNDIIFSNDDINLIKEKINSCQFKYIIPSQKK